MSIASLLLTLSLLANVALLAKLTRSGLESSRSIGQVAEIGKGVQLQGGFSSAARGNGSAVLEPGVVGERLRAAGYPAAMIDQIVIALVQYRDRAEYDELSRRVGLRPWLEGAARLRELDQGQVAEIMASTALGSAAKARTQFIRYGELDPDKVQHLTEVEKRFGVNMADLQISMQGTAPAFPRPTAASVAKARAFRAELGRILAPLEVNEYLLFNSPAAKRVQQNLGALDIDEATYRILAERTLAVEDSISRGRFGDGTAQMEEQLQVVATYQQVLGPGPFLRILPDMSRHAGTLDGVYARFGVNEADRNELAPLAIEAAAIMEDRGNRSVTGGRARELMERLVANPSFSQELIVAVRNTPLGRFLVTAREAMPQ